MEVVAVKPCKYCKDAGRYYPAIGKVLCPSHAEYKNQIRSIWKAIAHMQLEMPRG